MNRALRAATMGVLLLNPVALTACSAGQVSQTATQEGDELGAETEVGDITLRQIQLAYPDDGLYETGEDAELQLVIVNAGTEPDTLVGIEGEAFDGVVVSGQAAPSPTVPDSPPATPTTPGATPETTTPSPSPTPTAGTQVDIPIPPRSSVFLGGSDGPTVELADLSEELTTGESIEVTLTFAEAGEVTVPALVSAPDRVLPREDVFDFHEEEEGGEESAEDLALEDESEAGGGPGEPN
ncbi:hypothetical protein E4P41_09190 [Geodermatophilus sp. DF01-2]|uniref:hypothetical protein n=1 Tax=Geodermatophilus sp. DF01-2 TaxID=2559610 RepID=UPI0010744054|nr:hypothetical protein [Geodermatophilus sp. DF01_2]TFV61841.1 hypothetical protein E4P41_09190 [Geodermatophilus sp. DF01_2]